MVKQIDAGPIVRRTYFDIARPQSVTASELRDLTAKSLLNLFAEVVADVFAGETLDEFPNEGGKHYFRGDFERERSRSKEGMSAADVDRYTRAFHCPPHPGFGE